MRSYTINIIPEATTDPVVRISQFDKNYPIYFTLMNGTDELDLTGYTATFRLKKPDGKKVYEECVIADNKVIVYVMAQMSAAAGAGSANITLTTSGSASQESTSQFTFDIEAAAAPEDHWSSDYEMNYYEQLIARLEAATASIEDDLDTVEGYAETASTAATNAAASAQYAQAIALADVQACFPIGSILMTTTNTNPGTYIGGTWTAIEDVFLFAASTNHPAGETGGSETITLTEAQMPAHTHDLLTGLKISAGEGQMGTPGWGDYGACTEHPMSAAGEEWASGIAGGSEAHDNMPPYLAVYAWKRTA